MRSRFYFSILRLIKARYTGIKHEIKQYWLCLYTLLGWATRANNSFFEGEGCKVVRFKERVKSKRLSTAVTNKTLKPLDGFLTMKLNSSEQREFISRSCVSFFFRFLSLEQLATLKTSFIKTKFYPIHLRETVTVFHDANLFPGRKTYIPSCT